MNAQWLLGWWNLIFLVPFGLALVYLGFYTLTGVTFGETDADVDGDVDADADADVDADADLDADADVDADADADAEIEADGDADAHDADGHDAEGIEGGDGRVPLVVGMLSLIGVGRVPLAIVLTVLLLTWGAVGFITNAVMQPRVSAGWQAAAVSVPSAALLGLVVARGVAGLVGRFLPLNETSARRRHELLGHTGRALYPVTGQFGLVAVRDEEGNLFQVPCRVSPGRDDIAKGGAVRLVGYSAKQQIYDVIPATPAGTTPTPAARG